MTLSLRWQMQLWHAVVLTTVLAAFGSAVALLQWQSRVQQIDVELGRTTDAVMSQLRALLPMPAFRPPWGRDPAAARTTEAGGVRPFDPGPGVRPPDDPLRDPSPRDERDARRLPGPRWFPGGPPPPFPQTFQLPDEFVKLFEGDTTSRFDYTIWRRDGTRLHKSDWAPDVPCPGLEVDPNALPTRTTRHRDGRREMVATVFDLNIVVGRSIQNDVEQHRQFTLMLALVGGGVLGGGLLGGWFLASRAIRPIAAMSETARSISARNLSQRIDLKYTATELNELGTMLNDAFDRLESAFEQQARFTADASHELRTPVAILMANLELALSRPRTAEDYQKTLNVCLRAAQRMRSLIDSLLTLSRFDSGDPELKREAVDLEKLTVECAEWVRTLADQRGITVTCHTRPVVLTGDRERLSQVLTNLLSNAIRYNRDGGRIDVTLTEDSGRAVLSVADTGIGIPADDLPRVFDRFYRVDKARSRAEGGSGLGLAICRTIVEAHRGTLMVRSQVNVGSEFEIRLPLVPVPRPQPEPAALAGA